MRNELMYIDRINGTWQAFTYSDAERHYIMNAYLLSSIEAFAKKHGYTILHINKI
jgi:hypothetical protein